MIQMEQDKLCLYDDILSCLQELISIARLKRTALVMRRHAQLHSLAAQENSLLQQLQRLKAERASLDNTLRNPRAVAKIAAAVAELQQLNGINSSLIREHLDSVEMCLAMLNKAMNSDYAGSADQRCKTVLNGVVDMQA